MTSEAHRSASVDRHFLLFEDLLRGRVHDRHSLAKRLGIQPAMAHRLMKSALKLPGVVGQREGRQYTIRLELAALSPAPSYPTAVAACFGSSLWPLFEGTSYRQGIRDALGDVIGRTKRRTVFKDIDRKFWFLRRGGEVALLDRSPLLDDVIDAVLRHRVLSLEYTRFSGDAQQLRLEPLSIVVHDHQLYVVARDDNGELHPYRFSRIRAVDVLDESFRYPDRSAYDPEQVFRDSFGIFLGLPVQDVELKLHKRWATYVQSHRWHDSQRVEVAGDRVVVRMRVSVCPELVAWILGFGEQAEVVAPKGLRGEMGKRGAAIAVLYEEGGRVASRPPLRKTGGGSVEESGRRRRRR